MTHDELLEWSRRAAVWALHDHKGLRDRQVQAQVVYSAQLPGSASETPESMAQIFADFEAIVPDAMTHWQHRLKNLQTRLQRLAVVKS